MLNISKLKKRLSGKQIISVEFNVPAELSEAFLQFFFRMQNEFSAKNYSTTTKSLNIAFFGGKKRQNSIYI